jgi:putative Holliday junction resolvase
MARLLAIDYGKKRTGLAVSDPLQIIATGLTTVETSQLITYLKKYFEQEMVETVIIGLPMRLNTLPTDATSLVLAFIPLFQKHFPTIPIQTVDERFTSKMAFQTMIDSGLKQKARRNKALVDEISATILLQSFMAKV